MNANGTFRPQGLVELRDGGGTMVGDISRTGTGIIVYNAHLKKADSERALEFHQPVNVPWSAVLYWSISRKDG